MPNKRLSEREYRRLATRRERHGEDFDRQNATYASSFSTTRFNSETGSKAAKAKWKKYREEKLLEREELERVKAMEENKEEL